MGALLGVGGIDWPQAIAALAKSAMTKPMLYICRKPVIIIVRPTEHKAPAITPRSMSPEYLDKKNPYVRILHLIL
jgi:hypothetical protein